MTQFIDQDRHRFGVEPICTVLPIAPSMYYTQAARRADPTSLPPRAKQDAVLLPEVQRVYRENFEVCGVRKVWRQLRREQVDVARCTVRQGFVYVAFIIDVFARRIVGWKASAAAHTDFMLDALEQALHERRRVAGERLVAHTHRGSQLQFNWSSQHGAPGGSGHRAIRRQRRGFVWQRHQQVTELPMAA